MTAAMFGTSTHYAVLLSVGRGWSTARVYEHTLIGDVTVSVQAIDHVALRALT